MIFETFFIVLLHQQYRQLLSNNFNQTTEHGFSKFPTAARII